MSMAAQNELSRIMQSQVDILSQQMFMNTTGLTVTRTALSMLTPLQGAPAPKTVVAVIGSSRRRIVLEDE